MVALALGDLDDMKIDAFSCCSVVGGGGADGLDGVGTGDQKFVICEVSMDKSLQVSTEAAQLSAG